jgi:hypothetical protein
MPSHGEARSSELVGTSSDDVDDILATGRTDVTTIFVSMATRHPEGRDAAYLEWHSLDHRPEQHRLRDLRYSFRLVSTPACRAARAASDERFYAVDHLMTYLFTDVAGLAAFTRLNSAMSEAGRTPFVMPPVERAVYRLDGTVAAPRIKVGADVMPWWPAKGVYLMIERGTASPAQLVDVPGIGGVWWGAALPLDPPYVTADTTGLQITYCFLDDEPAEVGERLRPVLASRWGDAEVTPLLAAPFHTLGDYDWARYVP